MFLTLYIESYQLWLLIVSEALLVACSLVVYLHLKNRKLRRQIGKDPESRSDDKTSYALQLDYHIEQTNDELNRLGSVEDESDRAALRSRLQYLGREKAVLAEMESNPESDAWSLLKSMYAESHAESVDSAGPAFEEKDASTISLLQTKISAYETRIVNLEKFKDMFFELKTKLEASQLLNDRLHTEVDKAIPLDQRSEELTEVMQKLKEENVYLMTRIARIEEQFADIVGQAGENQLLSDAEKEVARPVEIELIQTNVAGSMDNIDQGVEQIKQVISIQEQRIAELGALVNGLQLELEDKKKLNSVLQDVESKNDELNSVIAILEEENTFLQEQISALLKQELKTEEETKTELQTIKAEIGELKIENAELENKYASMEQKYLSVYEENQSLKARDIN